MNLRYQRLFDAAGARTAVIPFLVLGDPDLDTSARLLDALAGHGIDAIELGLPFSDPVADGPVIQAASVRALAAGATPERCWTLVERLRARTPDLPIGLLVYANLVVHRGAAAFYHRAALAGADSVLIADVPVAEADPFVAEAERHGIAPVLIDRPTPRPNGWPGLPGSPGDTPTSPAGPASPAHGDPIPPSSPPSWPSSGPSALRRRYSGSGLPNRTTSTRPAGSAPAALSPDPP